MQKCKYDIETSKMISMCNHFAESRLVTMQIGKGRILNR